MDDARERFVRFLWERGDTHIDDVSHDWSCRIHGSLIDTVYYIICAYIRKERDADIEFGMGTLEREYLCTDDFVNAEDARKWIEENRELNDRGLIAFIFDNVYRMTPGKHRRALLYILNILYFGL
jgi:hypothetical protein